MRQLEGTITEVRMPSEQERQEAISKKLFQHVCLVVCVKGDVQIIQVSEEAFNELFPEGELSAIGQTITANSSCEECQYHLTCYHRFTTAQGREYKKVGCPYIRSYPAGYLGLVNRLS